MHFVHPVQDEINVRDRSPRRRRYRLRDEESLAIGRKVVASNRNAAEPEVEPRELEQHARFSTRLAVACDLVAPVVHA
jgi:hypothetical protein